MFEKIKKNLKEYFKLIVSLLACLVMIFTSIIIFPFSKEDKAVKTDTIVSSGVSAICELATIRCYYHNVAEYEKQPDGLFKYGLFKYGYKKMWLEYSGIVEVGIDVNEVEISNPDKNNVIQIYVPDARILSVHADNSSLEKPLVDTGVFTEITVEDEAVAFSVAQENMDNEAQKDKNLLAQAKERAKELLKEYVINVGKQTGNSYTIKWIQK